MERWLRSKQSKKSWRAILNRFRIYADLDDFQALLNLEEPNQTVRMWVDSLDLAPGSMLSYISRVKSFYAYFGISLAGPFPRIRKRVTYPHKVLTEKEIHVMIDHSDVREKALIWVLYSSGARVSSILGLTVGRVDLRGEAPVQLHLYPAETKFNVEYDTFLCEEALEALRNYLKWRIRQGDKVGDASPLWTTKYKQPLHYDGALKALKRVAAKADIKIREHERLGHHSFRAAFHRNLQVHGVNQYIVERLMGHATENTTTGRYSIGLTLDDLRDAYRKASWSLEVDEEKVKLLQEKVDDTQRALGEEVLMRRKIEEIYSKELEEIRSDMEKRDKKILKLIEKEGGQK